MGLPFRAKFRVERCILSPSSRAGVRAVVAVLVAANGNLSLCLGVETLVQEFRAYLLRRALVPQKHQLES